MPRSGRGGRQTPTAGVPRPNRTDMTAPQAPEPIATVPGQGYGEAASQRAAQQAIPLAGEATAQATVGPSGSGGVSAGASPAAPQQGPYPGELVGLDAPTQRPNEPVTAGLPNSPGPGPEANIGVGSAGMVHQNVSNLLNALSQVPGASPDIAKLAIYSQGRG